MAVKHKPLPIAGYTDQSRSNVELVNRNKEVEERVLRRLDELQLTEGTDLRWLAIARTQIEQGFMAMNRATFRPERISLPEDAE